MARYIRFRPVTWHSHISMRVEVYGCEQGNMIFFSIVSTINKIMKFSKVKWKYILKKGVYRDNLGKTAFI